MIKHFLQNHPGATLHQIAELCHQDYELANMALSHWQENGHIKHTCRKLSNRHCFKTCQGCATIDIDEYHWVEKP
ncbi:MAG: hypothetical protein CMF46_03330 [Legionellales bacterium]|nr:hypothetical protein [Legionellales bacterium]